MLRLRPSHTLRVRRIKGSLLSQLRPVVGDLQSAENELRWLREESEKRASEPKEQRSLLERYVSRRSRGEPLQYILGSTFFGDLELKCRPGVFIPRPETVAAVSYLVQAIFAAKTKPAEGEDVDAPDREKNKKQREILRMGKVVKVFDLCCGSGCIPLLFWHEFYNSAAASQVELPQLEIVGFDASSDALQLARENHAMIQSNREQLSETVGPTASNLQKSTSSLQSMKFLQANVLRGSSSPDELRKLMTLRQAIGQHFKEQNGSKKILEHVKDNDIWISNPPYISPEDYFKKTSRSVRDFEPKEALVPPETSTTSTGIAPKTGKVADKFYQDILGQAMELRAKVVLFEVGDMNQAKRVAKFAVDTRHWYVIEIWRDEPSSEAEVEYLPYKDKVISVQGSGNGRSVLVCNRDGAKLIGREPRVKVERFREWKSQEESSGEALEEPTNKPETKPDERPVGSNIRESPAEEKKVGKRDIFKRRQIEFAAHSESRHLHKAKDINWLVAKYRAGGEESNARVHVAQGAGSGGDGR